MSLEHHLSTLQASVEQQVSQLQQKILDQSEGGVTEALVSEMVRSQVEKMSMDQLQETNSKLQEVSFPTSGPNRCVCSCVRVWEGGSVDV